MAIWHNVKSQPAHMEPHVCPCQPCCGASHGKYPQLHIWQWKMQEVWLSADENWLGGLGDPPVSGLTVHDLLHMCAPPLVYSALLSIV